MNEGTIITYFMSKEYNPSITTCAHFKIWIFKIGGRQVTYHARGAINRYWYAFLFASGTLPLGLTILSPTSRIYITVFLPLLLRNTFVFLSLMAAIHGVRMCRCQRESRCCHLASCICSDQHIFRWYWVSWVQTREPPRRITRTWSERFFSACEFGEHLFNVEDQCPFILVFHEFCHRAFTVTLVWYAERDAVKCWVIKNPGIVPFYIFFTLCKRVVQMSTARINIISQLPREMRIESFSQSRIVHVSRVVGNKRQLSVYL